MQQTHKTHKDITASKQPAEEMLK